MGNARDEARTLPAEERYALVEEAAKTFGEAAASSLAGELGIKWPITIVPFKPVLVRLWSGIVTGGDTPEYIGKRVYYVDMVEEDGGVASMHDGLDYHEARREALLLATDGLHFRDEVVQVVQ